MRASYYSTMLSELPLAEAAAEVVKAGYTDLAINCDGIPSKFAPHMTAETPVDECRRLAGTVREAGLGIPAVSSNFYFFAKDDAERLRGLDYVTRMLDRVKVMDVDYVHLCSSKPYPGKSEDEMFDIFIETWREILRQAEARGISVGLESCAPHMYPQTARYEQLIEELAPQKLYVNFDPSHFVAIGEDPAKAVERLADSIRHVHIKDAKGRFPNFSFPPLGEGEVDFPALISALSKIGYDGAMTIEYEANYFGWKLSPMEVLDSSRKFLRDLGI
ncbi:sugar phosphate isomerase/epimerase [Mesorhizobium sp. B2-4-15]|uniref:sugar phosphate isomerase/epimerase family protein n=1 Tax=Mesorhizobium sp. B2-4-15 TaxID=2589934 RepID=UPI001154CEE0|nr:sugar phosphate isomerase/epimerase family protein [Mesorhizobium sp. B2-4-15]TPK73607.1 sugar phosphate isomerase/epimerase [Mesorhizobium sp. B2-4-15]